MATILELKNISMNYHSPNFETIAIEDISFSVEKGEFISIVGPSGCGKSTLLSIISKLIKPSKGEVIIDGKLSLTPDTKVGYMLQKDHLFGWRTILQNVFLGLEITNQLTQENKILAENLLEKYGLKDFKNHFPSELSGGMRQRASLIRTLMLQPEILLLDEPFSALDYQTRLYVADEISEIIKKEGKTAILVTHDISEAISIADRVIVLSGRPSKIKAIHDIKFSIENRTPMKSREASEFKDYFNIIWKELDIHES